MATQKWKAKAAKVKLQQTLSLAMFKPRPKVVPTVHAPEVVGSNIPITSTENGDLPISSESLINTPVIVHPTALTSQPQPTLAVSRLAQCVLQLPDPLSGEGPVPVRPGLVSTGIDPMRRGLASLKGPLSLLSQWPKRSVQGLYRD